MKTFTTGFSIISLKNVEVLFWEDEPIAVLFFKENAVMMLDELDEMGKCRLEDWISPFQKNLKLTRKVSHQRLKELVDAI